MKEMTIVNWQFMLGDDRNAWFKDFPDTDWQAVTVPHDWSIAQDFDKNCSSGTGYLPGGIAWYRAHYDISKLADLADKVVQLQFDGVYKNADVWVNGYHLGYRPSGYSSFQFDLTEFLPFRADDDLVIAVRVDHTDIADSRWYNGSGINRPVRLVVLEEAHVGRYDTTFVTHSIEDHKARVTVDTLVTNTSSVNKKIKVTPTLSLIGGNHTITLPSLEQTVGSHEQTSFAFESIIEQAQLWSPEAPHLYQLSIELTDGGKQSVYQERVGLRTFNFDADHGFRLNDEQTYKLKGVCLHEDAGSFGNAVPTVVWLRRLIKLKEMGCNAIRMAHNPHATNLYDLCDLLGFFVFDEAFDEWENPKNKWWQGHNVYPPKFEGYAKDFPVWHEQDLVDMVARNKNRPAIIAWSIGNEVDYPNDPYANPLFQEMTGNNDNQKPAEERQYNPHRPNTKRLSQIAKRLAEIVRQQDPTRPVTLAAAFPELSKKTGLLDDLDVVGYNYKEQYYEEDHQLFPTKPLLGSENGHGYQEWLAVADNDYISGQFLWTGIDYLGEAHGWPIHGSGAGNLTLAGFEKTRFYARQSWWSETLMVKLFTCLHDPQAGHPEWVPVYRRWNYAEGEQVEIRCFTNGEALQLTNNGTPIDLVFNEQFGYYHALVDFQAGKLVAEATTADTQAVDVLEAVGEVQQLVGRVWEDTPATDQLVAAGIAVEGIAQIELTLVDKDGRPTTAEKIVRFQGTNCQLLGFENGDLADVTAYSEEWRRSYDGKIMAFVQPEPGGHAQFEVEGLKPLRVDF